MYIQPQPPYPEDWPDLWEVYISINLVLLKVSMPVFLSGYVSLVKWMYTASFFATTDSKPQRRDSVLVHMFHSVLKCSLQRSYKTHFNSHTESHTLIIVHENQPNTTEKLRIIIISLFAL